jgi:hypothetical protein
MKHVCLLALLVSVGMAGCADAPTPISPYDAAEQPQMSLQDRPAPPGQLVATPNGWYHRSCVHELPDGARRNRDKTVTRKDGTVFQTQKCLFPGRRNSDGNRARPRSRRGGQGQGPVGDPVNNGYMEFAHHSLSGESYGYLSAEWEVPDDPSGSYSAGDVYFTFPGIQGQGREDYYILQPVLEYHNRGGSFWSLASWYCDDGGDCASNGYISASAGDQVRGSVEALDCVDRVCTWTITTWNETTQDSTIQEFEDTLNYNFGIGGAAEVRSLESCLQYPTPGVSYSSITLKDEDGDPVSPSWFHAYESNPSPDCNFDISSTSSTVDLVHYGTMQAQITGDDEVAPDEECGWQAWPNGGVLPFSYSWWGALTGSSQTIYGDLSESSYLWVEITDALSKKDTAQIFIDVDEAHECDWR